MITQKELKELLNYNPKTGIFKWKKDIGYKTKRDQMAGSRHNDGYIRIQINHKMYFAHRLIWLYQYGDFPKNQIDHINHNGHDNRIENLRDINQQENSKNMTISKRNTSGVVGVSYRKDTNKWSAQITVNYKQIRLGSFENKDDAIKARKEAELKYEFHSNHGRRA